MDWGCITKNIDRWQNKCNEYHSRNIGKKSLLVLDVRGWKWYPYNADRDQSKLSRNLSNTTDSHAQTYRAHFSRTHVQKAHVREMNVFTLPLLSVISGFAFLYVAIP